MANLIFDIDIEDIKKQIEDTGKSLKKDLINGVEKLAVMTHAKVMEFAKDNLHSSAKTYMDNVAFDQISENMWIVTLKEPALWIEEGMRGGFMKWLLEDKNGKGQVKTNKKGEKYRVIPFEHSKAPAEQTANARELTDAIKKEFKKQNIPFKRIETTPEGSPRIGKLHTINIESARPSKSAKTPALSGVTVYQSKDKNTGKVRRDIFTFRVISEKHEKEGLWVHPGKEAKKFMDKAFDWCMNTWEKEILPTILEKYK
ncbi:MAG: hypothetical protein PHF86_09685 [Candidatus Nanoarchaeia archaeon]|jgi:hypothetical protein|nr:hypothetical protein [Candidatus Nanoarchaeia archaeon]